MLSSVIISGILNRFKFWASKRPNSTSSFIPNKSGTSFYLMQYRGENKEPIQIRISNHGTYLKTWADREHLGKSIKRFDPAHSINISIVFVDEDTNITNDCIGKSNCEDCDIPICKPETFDGQDQIGRPYKVYQYVYQSKDITQSYIKAITKAIFEASRKGVFVDPLRNITRASKCKEFISSTTLQKEREKKQRNKNKIRLTESQLRQIICETVKRILLTA